MQFVQKNIMWENGNSTIFNTNNSLNKIIERGK